VTGYGLIADIPQHALHEKRLAASPVVRLGHLSVVIPTGLRQLREAQSRVPATGNKVVVQQYHGLFPALLAVHHLDQLACMFPCVAMCS
jgi:hypothetical protein